MNLTQEQIDMIKSMRQEFDKDPQGYLYNFLNQTKQNISAINFTYQNLLKQH